MWTVAFVIISGAAAGASAVSEAACEPWPGEINPLPSIEDRDPFSARWAWLRARELRILATALETERPDAAYELREHVRCLESASADQTTQLPSLSPRVLIGPRLFVIRPKPPASERPSIDLKPVEKLLANAQNELDNARFQRVLELAEQARGVLGTMVDVAAVLERRAQLEVLEGSALVALGRSDEAGASFRRALSSNPDLQLDVATTSPKIRRIFAEARAERGAANP